MIGNLKKSWSVGYKMKIDSNVDDLWNVITKPGHLEMVHPFCKENYPILWDKENSKDVLVYTNGVKLIREFKSWKEKQGYSLEIGTKNGRKSLVEWKISTENQKTYLSIRVYTFFMRDRNLILSFLPHFIFIYPNLRRYLKSVIGGINYYLQNKKRVPRNYFGSHRWFS